MRLVKGKVTLVHRHVWCALVRVADRFPIDSLAALREEHTATGAHRVVQQAFPGWVPLDVLRLARDLSEEAALAELPACLRTSTDESTGRRRS